MAEFTGGIEKIEKALEGAIPQRHPILERIERIENVLKEIFPGAFEPHGQPGTVPQPLQVQFVPPPPPPPLPLRPQFVPAVPEAEEYHPELENPELILHGTRIGWTFITGAKFYHFALNGKTLCNLHRKRGEFLKIPTPGRSHCCKQCVKRVSQKVDILKSRIEGALNQLRKSYEHWERIDENEKGHWIHEVIERVKRQTGPPFEEDLPFATHDDLSGPHSRPVE